MTNEQLLYEIGIMLDTKLEEKLETKLEEKLETKLEEKLDAKLEQKLDAKLEEKLDAKLEEKFDQKLAPIYERLDRLESRVDKIEITQETRILPVLGDIVAQYSSAFKIFMDKSAKIDSMADDIDMLKSITQKHSKMLANLA